MFSALRIGGGRLSLFDLYRMTLDVDLVTLSGCVTGVSHVAGADELIGLVRGFLLAGARALVVSLWDVHDRSTAHLMSSFYDAFLGGQPAVKALQTAMSEVRASHPSPYFWAPFFLLGASQPPT